MATSDLDIVIRPTEFETLTSELQTAVKAVVRRRFGPNCLPLSEPTLPEDFPVAHVAAINPIVIKITKEEVSLEIYPPYKLDYVDQVAGKDEPYPTPLSFRIDSAD